MGEVAREAVFREAAAHQEGWRAAMQSLRDDSDPEGLSARLQAMKPLIPSIYGPLVDQACAALSRPAPSGGYGEAIEDAAELIEETEDLIDHDPPDGTSITDATRIRLAKAIRALSPALKTGRE